MVREDASVLCEVEMTERIYRYLDIADYILCRYGPLSFPSWADFEKSGSRKLYAGKLRRALPQFATHFGVTPFYASTRNIKHDLVEPFPIPDGSVDTFQSEDVFEHIELAKMVSVFNEIYRVLSPGGLFRLSLPDYHLDLNVERSQKDSDGKIVFDPGGGGQFVDGRIIGGGHLWFPRIELQSIDYSLGYIQRTPDHDDRASNSLRPISIVVDAFKSPG
jgi:SAM-dependent methyltransferase